PAQNFVDSVTEDEAAVVNGYACFRARDKRAVHINDVFQSQAFVPDVVYSHPPTLNIGDDPGAGSVRVPVKVLVAVIVPRNSIPAALPLEALRIRLVNPSLRRTEPLIGRTTVVGGFFQLLVEALTVPSESTSRWAVITCPSASEPPEHGSVVVFRSVKDQSPAACACVTAPPLGPPM